MGDKGKGLLSYLVGAVGGIIVLFAMKNNTKRDVMHAGQAIVIDIAYLAFTVLVSILSSMVDMFSYLSAVGGILRLVLVIMGIAKVLSNSNPDPKLPIIGDWAEKMFAKQLAAAPEFANPTASVNPQANFDPNTGEPINKQPVEAKFDPNTGEPINNQTTTEQSTTNTDNNQNN